ncbi:MAG: extracellular solute-binding protein [Firmicutes bacterium]|nr:extracellular solute-binding protein [Bacillota bacterium]
MSRLRKSVMVTSSMALLAGGLSACGVGNATSVNSATIRPSYQKFHGTINVDFAGTPGEGWHAIAAAYEKVQPGVKINIQWQNPSTYNTWLTAQFSAGHPTADLVTNNEVAQLIAEGKFVNFQPWLFKEDPYTHKLWLDSFNWNEIGYDPYTGYGVGTSGTGKLYQLNYQMVQVIWMYNKRLWHKAGIYTTPTTFNQLIADFKKLKASGTIPLALGGTYNSLWADKGGWVVRMYADQYTRSSVRDAVARPGDYDYVAAINGKWHYDPSNPNNDNSNEVIVNPVRQWLLVKEAKRPTYNLASPNWMALDRNLRTLFSYTEPGFVGVSDTEADSLFLSQKAATELTGSWTLSDFPKDLKNSLYTGGKGKTFKSFSYGFFNNPSMTGPYVEAPARTISLPIGFLGFVNKNPQQTALDMNFMMWLTSPKGQEIALEAALKSPNGSVTPVAINGVKLPGSLGKEFAELKYIGNSEGKPTTAAMIARGLADYQPSVVAWVALTQKYLSGHMSTKAYAKADEANIQKYFVAALENVGNMTPADLRTPWKAPVPPVKH